MMPGSLQELSAVLAIARRRTFRAAAVEMAMSTTALSHMIARLEAQLGVRLFNRTTRSVSLTEAGQIFVSAVGPALQGLNDALETVRAQRDAPAGTIRINAAPFAARQIISPLITQFLRRYPDVHVDLVTEARLVDIVAEGFDLGARVTSLVPADMIALPLNRPQRYAIVATADYLQGKGRPTGPQDLLNHACIRVRLPDGSLFRWRFEKEGESLQVDVAGSVTLDETSVARAAVLDGVGIGCFMEESIAEDLEAGRLVRLLEDWTPPFGGLSLYYPGRRHLSAAMTAFLAMARELAKADNLPG